MSDSHDYIRKVLATVFISGQRWDINRWIVSRLNTLDITVATYSKRWAWSDEEAARRLRYPDAWATFNKCFNYTLDHNGDDFMLEVTVSEGDNLYGHPDRTRFTCIIRVPPECLHVFHKDAEATLYHYLDVAWQAHEDRRRARWIKAEMARVMGTAEDD